MLYTGLAAAVLRRLCFTGHRQHSSAQHCAQLPRASAVAFARPANRHRTKTSGIHRTPVSSVSTDATYTYTNTYSQTSAALGAFGNSEHADAALKVAVATSAAAAEPAEAAPHEELEGHACR